MQIYQQSSGNIQNSTHSMAEPHKLWLVALLLKIFLQLLSCCFFTRVHLQSHQRLAYSLRLQPFLPPLFTPIIRQDQNNKGMQILIPSTFSIWVVLFFSLSPLRQHLLFPCEQMLCNITKSSLCLFNLLWFRGGGCIAYLQIIIINLYRHQKSAQIRKSKLCNIFLYS